MIVYSFFLNYDRRIKYDFMKDHSHCLKETYSGFHPVIKNPDGSFQILYAMTSSKKLKSMFMETRDMAKFTYYKSEVSSDKYKDMKKNLWDTVLVKSTLIDLKNGLSEVPMCMTKYERENTNDELFIVEKLQEIFKSGKALSLFEKDVVSDEFMEKLDIFNFKDCLRLVAYGGANDSDIEIYESEFYFIMKDFLDRSILKTLEVFIDRYGNTLKGG